MDKIITVIVPSFNRAHLLEMTIPTYLQDGVKEVILVDDCSSDNTEEVVRKMQQDYPNIRYVRQPKNMKQHAAKNKGLELCTTEWVYFGDDDSVLYPGSIEKLYKTCLEYNVDACGAIAYYMNQGEEKMNLADYVKKHQIFTDNVNDIIDVANLKAKFIYSVKQPIVVPFCQACLLIKSEIAKEVKFDTSYIGNAYREETDFILRCSAKGVTFMYNSDAAQINLPTTLATGGARGKNVWKYKKDMIVNNWTFLKKNYPFLRDKYHLQKNTYRMQWDFMIGFVTRPLLRVIKKIR